MPKPTAGEPPSIDGHDTDQIAAWLEDRLTTVLALDAVHPEVREARERLLNEVRNIRRLLRRRSGPLPEPLALRLGQALARDPLESGGEDYAWGRADAVKAITLEVADQVYIETILATEMVRASKDGRVGWQRYFDPKELVELSAAYRSGQPTPEQQARAIERLAFLVQKRIQEGSHYRTRVEMRGLYFAKSAWVLAVLVPAFGVVLYAVGDTSAWTVVLTALAGALGSSVSGARALRGVLTVGGLRSVRGWMLVQPMVGAAAGLLMMLLLTSHVLGLPGANSVVVSPEALAAYGFVAGLSEPFFLGVVAKIAGAADEGADASRPGPPAKGPPATS